VASASWSSTSQDSKDHKQFVETLPSELAQVLRASVTFPRTIFWLVRATSRLRCDNFGLRSKNAMDKHFDRKLGINDLRHIYLTRTIVMTITREERNKKSHGR
jgi:hypothetical protein